jgi:hypothetical protein
MDMQELEKELFGIEKLAKGKLVVEVAGETTTGLPIFLSKFGEADAGKIRALIVGQSQQKLHK